MCVTQGRSLQTLLDPVPDKSFEVHGAQKTTNAARETEKEEREMAKPKIKPLGGHVLVEVVEEQEEAKGGIIIPDSAREKPQQAKIIALGTGERDDEGKKIPFNVKVGDRILMTQYGGTEISYGDREYKILSSDDILAVIG